MLKTIKTTLRHTVRQKHPDLIQRLVFSPNRQPRHAERLCEKFVLVMTANVSCCRFCVGDRFYLCENKILCEYDYEERLVFANMAYNPPSIAHIKRQTSHLPVSHNAARIGNSLLTFWHNLSGPVFKGQESKSLSNLWTRLRVSSPYGWLQASAAKQKGTALFWDITQRIGVISYWRFGTAYGSQLQGPRIHARFRCFLHSWPSKTGVVPKRREGITTIRRVRAQKSAVLIYLAAETWNLAHRWVSSPQLMCLPMPSLWLMSDASLTAQLCDDAFF